MEPEIGIGVGVGGPEEDQTLIRALAGELDPLLRVGGST